MLLNIGSFRIYMYLCVCVVYMCYIHPFINQTRYFQSRQGHLTLCKGIRLLTMKHTLRAANINHSNISTCAALEIQSRHYILRLYLNSLFQHQRIVRCSSEDFYLKKKKGEKKFDQGLLLKLCHVSRIQLKAATSICTDVCKSLHLKACSVCFTVFNDQ